MDILVNNAGGYRLFTDDLAHSVPFLELSEEVWHRVMSSNLTTAFLCCKAVLPHMVEQGSGAIINMSSGTVARGAVPDRLPIALPRQPWNASASPSPKT